MCYFYILLHTFSILQTFTYFYIRFTYFLHILHTIFTYGPILHTFTYFYIRSVFFTYATCNFTYGFYIRRASRAGETRDYGQFYIFLHTRKIRKNTVLQTILHTILHTYQFFTYDIFLHTFTYAERLAQARREST